MIAIKPNHLDVASISLLAEPSAIKAPTIIIPEIALVTDIRGVCNADVTDQTTKYPTKIASMNIVKSIINGSVILSFLRSKCLELYRHN